MSASGLPALYVSLALISLICIAFGPIVDQLSELNKDLSEDPSLPYSYERYDSWNFVMLMWDTWPVWVFLGGILATVIIAMRPSSGGAY